MTDVAPETVEALAATAERMVRSFRGQPQNLDQLACNEVASLIDRLHSLLLRAEEIEQALNETNRWIYSVVRAGYAQPFLSGAELRMVLNRSALATPEKTKEAGES